MPVVLEVKTGSKRLANGFSKARTLSRFSQTVHHGAASIDKNLSRVGAMKVQLGHVSASFGWEGQQRQTSVGCVLSAAIRRQK
jgi:hypothetical protein